MGRVRVLEVSSLTFTAAVAEAENFRCLCTGERGGVWIPVTADRSWGSGPLSTDSKEVLSICSVRCDCATRGESHISGPFARTVARNGGPALQGLRLPQGHSWLHGTGRGKPRARGVQSSERGRCPGSIQGGDFTDGDGTGGGGLKGCFRRFGCLRSSNPCSFSRTMCGDGLGVEHGVANLSHFGVGVPWD